MLIIIIAAAVRCGQSETAQGIKLSFGEGERNSGRVKFEN
jgi:hypothetical protein